MCSRVRPAVSVEPLQRKGSLDALGGTQLTHHRETHPFGTKKIVCDLPNLGAGDLGEPTLDILGWNDLSVTQQLVAEPHHLVFGVFQTEIDLADEKIPGL